MYKTNIFKIYLFFFGMLWMLSYIAYPLADAVHIEAKLINFAIFSSLFLLNILLIISYIINKQYMLNIPSNLTIFKLLLFLLYLQFLSSLIQNDIYEWIPTLIRYLLYISTFVIFYFGMTENMIKIENVSRLIFLLALILIGFGYYQIFSGNVHFVNGAYRVSGSFTTHHLGFALSAFVIFEYLFFIVVLRKENGLATRLLALLFTLLLLYLFFASHSRLLTAIFLVTNLFVLIHFNKKLFLKSIFIIFSIIAISVFLYLVINTDLFPRINALFDTSKIDSSTLYRIFIITETFNSLSDVEYFTGIGMGGFNNFFFINTGEDNVAAHNDYLLMFVEGGTLSIILYLLYQFLLLKVILTRNNTPIAMLSFILFFGIEILGFLQNAHYFYQAELVTPIVLAMLFATTYDQKRVRSLKKLKHKVQQH